MLQSIGSGHTIGDISVRRLPVFDENNPRENNPVYRWANRFHILTRPEVVHRQLLVDRGSEYDPRLLSESARLLRGQGYLYDAWVEPIAHCGDEVDIRVTTKDVWSFTPDVSFDRSGGDNTYRFSLRETNFLGTGTHLALTRKQDIDRDTTEFVYKNSHVRGSRWRVEAEFEDSDDGDEQFLYIARPFYSLDTRYAWSLRYRDTLQTDTQYDRGNKVSETDHDALDYSVSYGFSRGLVNGWVRRWWLGYRYLDSRFSMGDELPLPGRPVEDRKLSYPFVAFQLLEDNFTTEENLEQIHRTEDLHLGHSAFVRLGYATTGLGSDSDRLVLGARYSSSPLFSRRQYLMHRMSVEGMWNLDTQRTEDLVVDYDLKYFFRQSKRHAFFLRLNGTWAKNLNGNRQVRLGGLTGARAYDNRFQTGDRRILLTLEERTYTNLHLLNLVHVGWAVFLDLGRAWQTGEPRDEWLADVGVGLRLASSKSNIARVIHLDLAFPLTLRDDPDVDTYQFAVNLKTAF